MTDSRLIMHGYVSTVLLYQDNLVLCASGDQVKEYFFFIGCINSVCLGYHRFHGYLSQ